MCFITFLGVAVSGIIAAESSRNLLILVNGRLALICWVEYKALKSVFSLKPVSNSNLIVFESSCALKTLPYSPETWSIFD
jgi:hypothetical protein